MIGFIILPLAALAAYAMGGFDYLRRNLLPPVPPSNSVQAPFTPPFNGGQCSGNPSLGYMVFITRFYNPNTEQEYTNPNPVPFGEGMVQLPAGAKIQSIEIEDAGFFQRWRIRHSLGSTTSGGFGGGNVSGDIPITSFDVKIILYNYGNDTEVPDNCGNLDNPNPNPPPSDDGIASGAEPDFDDAEVVQAGIPFAGVLPFLGALNAALDAAKNALNALEAIKSVADAISKVADLLSRLGDYLNRKEKEENPANKEISRIDFGSISKDGFFRLYPSNGTSTKRAVYVDLQLLSIPVYYGKFFGKLSPNFYRFKSLGYISFVSPTFGIIETKQIEFSRISFEVPENASGCFYHLGLQGDIFANLSVFYLENK